MKVSKQSLSKLHWKLFFPLIGLLWLIIGITIIYFVSHEKQRQRENLENRLLNVSNTVIDAYERGDDLNETVDFIRLFIDNTTLAPLRITVYDRNGKMVADNSSATIIVYDKNGKVKPGFENLIYHNDLSAVQDMMLEDDRSMVCSKKSPDGKIYAFAALPYEGEVLTFLSIHPMVWIAIILLGIVLSVLTFFGVRAVCRNVYALRDFAEAVSSDHLPDDIDSWQFSKDELGDVSKHLLTLYRDRMRAEQEKILHERQIGMSVSHELKTPVGIIKGYLDTILESEDMPPELEHKFLVRAKENTDRLSTLINDLAMVMRLQDKSSVHNATIINFHKLASQLAEDIKHGQVTGNMKFEYNIPENCLVVGNESLLTNALLNLIYNSAKHSGGSKMFLRWIKAEGGFNIFMFSDNGMGVEDEHLGRLFDLFYRVDSGRTRKTGGSGLGLPMVRRVITAMGGEITVRNGNDGGLQFTFKLPAAV